MADRTANSTPNTTRQSRPAGRLPGELENPAKSFGGARRGTGRQLGRRGVDALQFRGNELEQPLARQRPLQRAVETDRDDLLAAAMIAPGLAEHRRRGERGFRADDDQHIALEQGAPTQQVEPFGLFVLARRAPRGRLEAAIVAPAGQLLVKRRGVDFAVERTIGNKIVVAEQRVPDPAQQRSSRQAIGRRRLLGRCRNFFGTHLAPAKLAA